MDLQSMLMNLVPSSLYRGAAQSRVTHTPVIMNRNYVPSNMDATYNQSFAPTDLPTMLLAHLPLNKGVIHMDPNSSNVPAMMQHEQMHASLAPLSEAQLNDLQKNLPGNAEVQKKVGAIEAYPLDEAPAFMGAYTGQATTGVSPDVQGPWKAGFQQNLRAAYPTISRQYDRLAHPTAVNATAAAGENGASQ